MQNCFKKLCLAPALIFVFITASCYGSSRHGPDFIFYRCALVRDLSASFENSLKLNPPPVPIDLELAREQHEDYIDLLRTLVPEVIRLPGDENHPDCNFIEDTAIIVDGTAVISRMGAVERLGEEVAVAEALEHLNIDTIYLEFPATMDGGDILYTGNHLFVGLSRRTNESALRQLQAIFKGRLEVIGIPVTEGLHLKSLISLFDDETLVIADTDGGHEIQNQIQLWTGPSYAFVCVPDAVASNVLRIGAALIVQEGFPASEKILQNHCEHKQIKMLKLNMSELIKADGALTCGSLLF